MREKLAHKCEMFRIACYANVASILIVAVLSIVFNNFAYNAFSILLILLNEVVRNAIENDYDDEQAEDTEC
jgi:diacylglycerol kinase